MRKIFLKPYFYLLIIFIVCFQPNKLYPQDFNLRLNTATNIQVEPFWDLILGMSPCATDGYDPGLDTIQPPIPPGIFAVAIITGGQMFSTDILSSSLEERVFKIFHSFGEPQNGIDTIIFSWDTTSVSSIGSFVLQDQITGGSFFTMDMSTNNNIKITRGSFLSYIRLQISVIANEISTTKKIIPQWNLLSLPLKVTNRHYLQLFPNSTPGTLLEFDGSGYVPTDSLKQGRGYWLKFPNADSVSITGGDFGTVEVALDSGWNMIGGVSRDVLFDRINDPNDIIIPGTLFGFNGVYTTSDTIRPGNGYWVRTFTSGLVTISCVASLQGFGKSLAAPIALDDFPFLTISDAGGNGQRLYFNVKLDNPRQKLSYSLPPKMNGIFDARFEGDYRICENDEGVIEIQATSYPITVMAENLQMDTGEEYALVEIVAETEGKLHPLKTGERVIIRNPLVKRLRLSKVQNVPTEFALSQNYPNPFNPATTIKYQLPTSSEVGLEIYNMLGQKIRALVNGNQKPGYYEVIWDGRNSHGQQVGSGLYIYRFSARTLDGSHNFVQMNKMLVIR